MQYRVPTAALDKALESVEARGDTDIFPLPIEYSAIRHNWDTIRGWLSGQDLDTYSARPHRQSLSTKRALGYRFATALDPFDHLLATALTVEMAPKLEATRVPVADNRVHSYRFDEELLEEEALLYTYEYNYSTFHEASLAQAPDDGWVVATDIADFYSRLYLHPVESALQALPGVEDQARGFLKLLKAWNQNVSYGIPVGPPFSRLIAEATIADVDQVLLAEGVDFYRYSDDYRLIVPTRREGHRVLSILAESLSHMHGLSLNESKTEITRVADFRARWEERGDRPTVRDLIAELESVVGWSLASTIYNDEISEHELPREVIEALDRLDLPELVRHELDVRTPEPAEPDYPVVRFALGQMIAAHKDCIDVLERHATRLYPIAPRLASYLAHAAASPAFEAEKQDKAGQITLQLLDDPAASSLPYLRTWWLEAARSAGIPAEVVAQQYAAHFDDFTRPSALLAAAESQHIAWLRPRKRELAQMTPWGRRALIAALSVLPEEEYQAWTRANLRSFDELEKAVAKWADDEEPFS